MAHRILVLPSRHFEAIFPPAVMQELKALGEVRLAEPIPHNDPQARQKLAAALSSTRPEVLVTGWGVPPIAQEHLAANPQLKFIQHSAGTVRAYLERAVLAALGAPLVANWGDTISPSVAEAALMMTLAGLRRVAHLQLELHQRKGWAGKQAGESLFERPVGLHGFGAISQEYAKLLKPFGCPLTAYSPNVPDSLLRDFGVGRAASLKELYRTHHILAVHAGNTPENFHIVNQELLGLLPNGALLVNTARGEIIDTEALVRELRSGRIFAALDVYEQEPLPAEHPLRGLENCLLMPHVGGPTPDWYPRMGRNVVQNIGRYLRGEPPRHLIDLKVYDRST